MTQCNSCCFHYQCTKKQGHYGVHVFVANIHNRSEVREIHWIKEESK